MNILIDSDIPYVHGVFEPHANVEYVKGNAISAADIARADALFIRTRTRCDRELLEGSPVKMIATATIGFDHIDMDYCREAGIKVATAAGSNARGVLQWVAAALVYASQQQGWEPKDKTLGVVGVGNVGKLIVQYANHWGFNVLCCDPPRRRNEEKNPLGEDFVPCGKIATDADIISFHVPLTYDGLDKTYHMVGSLLFDNMKDGCLILNSSRGEIVDSMMFMRAMGEGRCSGCIDTWEYEPNIYEEALELAMLATPHVAGYSAQGKANASSMSVQAIAREFGLPLTEWYPGGDVPRVEPRMIGWEELKNTIGNYYDIYAESERLKADRKAFEQMRNEYKYRQEYF